MALMGLLKAASHLWRRVASSHTSWGTGATCACSSIHSMVTTSTGQEHMWQAGWQLGGHFCRGADLPSSHKACKKPQTLYLHQSTAPKMTGQGQTKAGQDNLVPLGVENVLGFTEKSHKPKECFFQRHHSSSDSKAQCSGSVKQRGSTDSSHQISCWPVC